MAVLIVLLATQLRPSTYIHVFIRIYVHTYVCMHQVSDHLCSLGQPKTYYVDQADFKFGFYL